jgi:uncharacterized protein YwgA
MQQPADEQLQSADLILLLLAATGPTGKPDNRIDGITRLEKLLFLIDQETHVPRSVVEPFRFRPYSYGPYSREVYEAVELLEEAGLIREDRVLEGHTLDEMEQAAAAAIEKEGIERRFALTDDGLAVARLLARRHSNAFDEVARIKQSYAEMPLSRLIRYVYGKYPSYAEQSRIRDQVF